MVQSVVNRRALVAGLVAVAATAQSMASENVPTNARATDPAFAAIERHRAAAMEYMRAGSVRSNTVDAKWAPDYCEATFQAADQADKAAWDAMESAAGVLLATPPRTQAGALALLDYVEQFNSGAFHYNGEWSSAPCMWSSDTPYPDDDQDGFGWLLLRTMRESLAELPAGLALAARRQDTADPVFALIEAHGRASQEFRTALQAQAAAEARAWKIKPPRVRLSVLYDLSGQQKRTFYAHSAQEICDYFDRLSCPPCDPKRLATRRARKLARLRALEAEADAAREASGLAAVMEIVETTMAAEIYARERIEKIPAATVAGMLAALEYMRVQLGPDGNDTLLRLPPDEFVAHVAVAVRRLALAA